jgi:glutamyl-tRNA synthetase/glutamyl-Q tRNA(Asp) synthetase
MPTAVRPNLAALLRLTGGPPLTRFAPSPTGYLHLGHVVNALYVWGIARATGGRVLLRIEDHDRVRCRPAFEAAILDDLAWLGFVPDAGRTPLCRQSDDEAPYRDALARLDEAGRIYACDCSRRRIAGERYDGHCRQRGLARKPGTGVRVRLDDGHVRAEDALLGPLDQCPADQSGDLLLRDRAGQWTYQFAVTVDDHRQGVSLVVRGADLVSSTGRQVALGALIGRAAPAVFLHHPLVLAADGRKLSKSAGDTGVRELRARGLSPEMVVGQAAAAVGLLPAVRPWSAGAADALFTSAEI